MQQNYNIEELRNKNIVLMTGGELEYLMMHCNRQLLDSYQPPARAEEHLYYGIEGIQKLFGASPSTANRIKRSGIIDDAITQVGRKIVVDGDKALALVKAAGGIKSILNK